MMMIAFGLGLGIYFLRKFKSFIGKTLVFLLFFAIGIAIGFIPDLIIYNVTLFSRPRDPLLYFTIPAVFVTILGITLGGVLSNKKPEKSFIDGTRTLAIWLFSLSTLFFISTFFMMNARETNIHAFLLILNFTFVPTLSFFLISEILKDRYNKNNENKIVSNNKVLIKLSLGVILFFALLFKLSYFIKEREENREYMKRTYGTHAQLKSLPSTVEAQRVINNNATEEARRIEKELRRDNHY